MEVSLCLLIYFTLSGSSDQIGSDFSSLAPFAPLSSLPRCLWLPLFLSPTRVVTLHRVLLDHPLFWISLPVRRSPTSLLVFTFPHSTAYLFVAHLTHTNRRRLPPLLLSPFLSFISPSLRDCDLGPESISGEAALSLAANPRVHWGDRTAARILTASFLAACLPVSPAVLFPTAAGAVSLSPEILRLWDLDRGIGSTGPDHHHVGSHLSPAVIEKPVDDRTRRPIASWRTLRVLTG